MLTITTSITKIDPCSESKGSKLSEKVMDIGKNIIQVLDNIKTFLGEVG